MIGPTIGFLGMWTFFMLTMLLGVTVALLAWLVAGALVERFKNRKKRRTRLIAESMFDSDTERYRGLSGEPPRNPRRYEVRG